MPDFPIPLEEEEQAAFVTWLELVGLRFTSIPNSTWTTSWKQKSKNHYTGLRPGFPDMIVIIPPNRSRDGQGHLLCIELKRVSGGVVSGSQKEWIAAINGLMSRNVCSRVCKGSKEAQAFVNEYLFPFKTSPF